MAQGDELTGRQTQRPQARETGRVPAARRAVHDRRGTPDVPSLQAIPGVDVTHANPARMYDYALDGSHNFKIDREVADAVFAVLPTGPAVARANRAFLRRAVEHCTEAGIDQFLDLGSGIPTSGNTHEIAQARNPGARVVYVDNEPVAAAHTSHLLERNDRAAMVRADLRDPAAVLEAEPVRRLLDFTRPVAVLMVAVLHYIGDDEGLPDLLAAYRLRCAAGSRLVISHTTQDRKPEVAGALRDVLARAGTEVTHRDRGAVRELFTGWRLLEPGVVWTPQWRAVPAPGERPADSETWCGVAELGL
ncbi:MAG: SAM-dependent methyltransferase [Saccharopolyspora sp.]|uniref:SAM-dependent methyltransferase n=1 Tax=unclassified Saccharopolyspora TaxID=2646250 RepID=UPI0025E566FD|nr:SAM-dependent methyltransferase [Saccharopolyspora sp.]MBQ6639891.1 SAM-dependent methyltransferase [Saccharopolyspora sp.]